jgi:hypothetical protein
LILVLFTAALVVAIAVFRGGSLDNLASTRFGWAWVLVGVFTVQIAVDLFGYDRLARPLAIFVLTITYVGAAAFMWLNHSLPGMAIAATGMAMNAVVIFANGAMPVSRWAARVAGIGELGEMGVKHEIAGENTVLAPLADVIPIANTSQIISIGDVVLAVGISVLVYRRTLGCRERATRVSG